MACRPSFWASCRGVYPSWLGKVNALWPFGWWITNWERWTRPKRTARWRMVSLGSRSAAKRTVNINDKRKMSAIINAEFTVSLCDWGRKGKSFSKCIPHSILHTHRLSISTKPGAGMNDQELCKVSLTSIKLVSNQDFAQCSVNTRACHKTYYELNLSRVDYM